VEFFCVLCLAVLSKSALVLYLLSKGGRGVTRFVLAYSKCNKKVNLGKYSASVTRQVTVLKLCLQLGTCRSSIAQNLLVCDRTCLRNYPLPFGLLDLRFRL